MVQSDRRENNFVPASDYKIVYKGSLKVKEEKSTKFVGDISLNMILYLNIDLKCSKTFFLELVWLSNHDKDCFMSVSVHSCSVILLFYLFWWSVAVVVVIWQYLCMSLYLWYHICILWFDTPFTILALMKLISYAQFEIFQHAPSFCHFPPPLWYVITPPNTYWKLHKTIYGLKFSLYHFYDLASLLLYSTSTSLH